MNYLETKFAKLGMDNAPGQEGRQKAKELDIRGEKLNGELVDFSHGDVDAHEPTPGAYEEFVAGVHIGGKQAYTEYRGHKQIREHVAQKLSEFTKCPIDYEQELIITPGTQAALFLAMGALVGRGDKVAIVEPDYFANRKLVEFFDGQLVPVRMDYANNTDKAGLDLSQLEQAFKDGVKVFLFSNPNNPTGVIYAHEEISQIAALAKQYDVALIVDELYSRQIFVDEARYTHLVSLSEKPATIITILGPSKTESLSGYRLGVAFGTAHIIERMEKLQAIVSLRAPGYSQATLRTWFAEPQGWIEQRIQAHRVIRDEILTKLQASQGVQARCTEAGSYLFVKFPPMAVSMADFIKILRQQANVIVTPGTEFGPQFADSFRLNFSQDQQKTLAAIDRILIMLERYRV